MGALDQKNAAYFSDTFNFLKDQSKECIEELVAVGTINLTSPSPLKDDQKGLYKCTIEFKVPFGTFVVAVSYGFSIAEQIVAEKYQHHKEKLREDMTRDLFSEYLNLFMGRIKRCYGSEDADASVPVTEPTTVQASGAPSAAPSSDTWQFEWKGHHVVMVCDLAVNDDADLSTINHDENEEDSQPGEIDFF